MTQQIQLDSKRIEAAICLYKAGLDFRYFPKKKVPAPIMEVYLEMTARDPERRVRFQDRFQYPTDPEAREAFFFQNVMLGETICKDEDLDGSFINAAAHDK